MAFFGFDGGRKAKMAFSDLGKYAEDFRIVEVTDQKGRLRRKTAYTGIWFVLRNRERDGWKLWAALVCALMLFAAHIWLLMTTHMASNELIVMIPLLVSLFPELYLLMGTFALPFRRKPQRRDQYMHSFVRIYRSVAAVSVCTGFAFLVSLVLRIIRSDWQFLSGDWVFSVLCLVILLLTFCLVFLLRSVPVDERENSLFKSPLL